MKNCKRCTAWRPYSDYTPVIYAPTPYQKAEYLRHTCNICLKEMKRKSWQKRGESETKRERARERARMKRRAEGIPARSIGPRNEGRYAGQDVHEFGQLLDGD